MPQSLPQTLPRAVKWMSLITFVTHWGKVLYYINAGRYVPEEPEVRCRWTGWVWEITGWSSRLQGKNNTYPLLMIWRLATRGGGAVNLMSSITCYIGSSMLQCLHNNIIQSHNIVLSDWQYFVEYPSHSVWMWGIFSRTDNKLTNVFHIQTECEEYSAQCC